MLLVGQIDHLSPCALSRLTPVPLTLDLSGHFNNGAKKSTGKCLPIACNVLLVPAAGTAAAPCVAPSAARAAELGPGAGSLRPPGVTGISALQRVSSPHWGQGRCAVCHWCPCAAADDTITPGTGGCPCCWGGAPTLGHRTSVFYINHVSLDKSSEL